MTTTATPVAEPTPAVKRGFALACILCGQECSISLDLDNLHTFNCPECEQTFSLDDVRGTIAAWQRVLAWVDSAPAQE